MNDTGLISIVLDGFTAMDEFPLVGAGLPSVKDHNDFIIDGCSCRRVYYVSSSS